jgi:hypothetical protein
MAQIDMKNCTFKFKDGGANSLEFKVGEGSMSFRERRNLIFTRNRGKLDLVKIGDDVPVEVNFDITWEFLKALGGASTPTPYEFLKKTGPAAGYTSAGPACEPWAIDIEVSNVTPCGSDSDEKITLPDFRPDRIEGGLRDAMLRVTGRCNSKEVNAVRF